MSLLFRYVARQYVAHLALVLLALVVLVLGVTLIENAGALSRDDNGPRAAWDLCKWSMCEYSYQNWPIAALIAVLSASTTLGRHGETLAMMATGMPPWRLALPYLCVAAAGACLMALGAETLLPQTLARKAATLERFGGRDPAATFYARRNQWLLQGDRLLFLPNVDMATATFAQPSVYTLQQGRITAVTYASQLVYDAAASSWVLLQAEQHRVDGAQIQRTASLALPLGLQPRDLMEVTGHPRQLGYAQLASLIGRRTRAGFDTSGHRFEYHARLAHPLAALGLVALALPWALDPSRRRSLVSTLGGGVVLVALYLSWSQLCRLWAMSRTIDVVVGAWGGVILCVMAVPLAAFVHRRLAR